MDRPLPTENGMPWNAPRLRSACVLILLCCLACAAPAQWVWRDKNGRPVYSDVPPPTSVKPGDVLRQPTLAPATSSTDSPEVAAPPAGNPTAPAAAAPAASAAPPTLLEREQEFRKRMKERADAEKKQADEQAQSARNADECQRARGYLKSLEDGMRLVRTNADGSREPLDESQREGETQRTARIVQERCK
jgi:hypothetical protein